MNPFYREITEPLAFSAISSAIVNETTQKVITDVRDLKQRIVTADVSSKQDRLIQRDELFDVLNNVLSPLYLMKETHPDNDVRASCQTAVEALFNFYNELNLDEELFQALASFAETEPDLSPAEARYVEQTMDDYLRNGFRLDVAGRHQLRQIDDELSGKELQFQRNIATGEAKLRFTADDLEGMPADFLESRRQDDGHILVTTAYPDYYPTMKMARREHVRKQLYFAYLNRAREENQLLLDDILKLRLRRARLLGCETFAELNLASVMAKKPETVWQFIEDLSDKVVKKARIDYRQLASFSGRDVIQPWDRFFITNNYKKERHQLDEQAVQNYFPLDKVLNGLFQLAQRLYGVDIREHEDLPVWHEQVRAFEIRDQGKLIGRFYLDLFPRPNKYNHAACFGLRSGRNCSAGYQLPEAALVCNFPRPTESKPSLLPHGDVETLFHEFGHLLHHLMTRSPLAAFAGTSVVRDFVEMPSQIMEHWAWEKEALQQFAVHYQTGAPISDELVARMLAAKQLNSGIDTQQQLLYAAIDMTLHHGFEPLTPLDTTRLVSQLAERHTLFPLPEGTCLQASFGHLVGYAAGYYGYLWSRVYADDLYSVFKQKGVFSSTAGHGFRQVLAAGGSVEPMKLIQDFLEREPNMDAFLVELGV